MKTLICIACCKRKADKRCPAKDLYQGALFKKSYAYAQKLGGRIVILSALYGVLYPDVEISPYERTLLGGSSMTKKEKEEWRKDVASDLKEFIEEGYQIIYLAGENYTKGLPEGEKPMKGLSIGRQLQWLSNKLKENEHVA